MNKELFANTKQLAGLIWRRDRIQTPLWLLCLLVFSISMASALPALYPPGPERQIIVETFDNPALISLLGPNFGRDNYHLGAIMAHQMLLFTALAVAIMNILLTIRHTRLDEERGRIEVIRSLPVGRLSNAAAVMLVLTLTNLCLGLFTALGLGALGLEGIDWPGSFLYGAVLSATGIFFAAITLLFAQLTETSRAALGMSFGFLGLAFLLRALGDISSEPLALLSPLGLVLRAQVFVENYWWPIWLTLAAAALLTGAAFKLNTSRDLGAGLIAAKAGRSKASRLLQSPLGLVLRLEKTTIIAWAVGLFLLGISYGSVFGDVEEFVKTSDLYQQILPSIEGYTAVDQFTVMLLALMAMMAAIPALLVMNKLQAEERAGRTEQLFARAVSRSSLLASFLVPALVVGLVMQLLSVTGLWLGAASALEDPFPLGKTVWAALAYVPCIWILVGLGASLIGFAPKLTNLTWIYLGCIFFVDYFGALLRLPEWLSKFTPWGYIPNLPLEKVGVGTIAGELLLGFALIAAAFYSYRRRDLQG